MDAADQLSDATAPIKIAVSPTGEIQTLSAARDAVRALRNAGERGDIDVVIADGTYYLDETVVFGLEDAAPAGASTRYRAADGASPIFSGGRAIRQWHKPDVTPEGLPPVAAGNIWVASVPWARNGRRFHGLYDGERSLPRARSREAQKMAAIDRDDRRYAGALKHRDWFCYQDGVRQWENCDDVEVFLSPVRAWLVNYLPVAQVDEQSKRVKTTVPATYTLSGDYWLENCLDVLDQPGEWVLDSHAGLLYYWPEEGVPSQDLVATALSELIRVQGENDTSLAGTGDHPVTGLIFEGLSFCQADRQRWEPDDHGLQHDWGMWNKANGLIRFDGAADCAVLGCTFRDSGSDGVRLDRYCQRIVIKDSIFARLGGTGVLLAGYGPGLKDVNHHNTIENNDISQCGTLFWHSPGIFVWQSGHNRIAQNHIYDLHYNGLVMAGVRRRFFQPIHGNTVFAEWEFVAENREHSRTIRWNEIDAGVDEDWDDYRPYMHARNNDIAYNEIHDCLKTLDDGNGIYLSAGGGNNRIRHNAVYRIAGPAGAIRCDDDSHHDAIVGNLLFGCITGVRMKGLNTVAHNVLIDCILDSGAAGNTAHANATIAHNTVVFYGSPPKHGFQHRLDVVLGGVNKNLYWHAGGAAPQLLQLQQNRSESGNDRDSLAADPQFRNLPIGDLDVLEGSPLFELDIEPLSTDTISKIGTKSNSFVQRHAHGMPFLHLGATIEVTGGGEAIKDGDWDDLPGS